jgi:hypothetical protein
MKPVGSLPALAIGQALVDKPQANNGTWKLIDIVELL